jgi:hypothetical protein
MLSALFTAHTCRKSFTAGIAAFAARRARCLEEPRRA